MTVPDYPRLATVIRAVLTRMVLNESPPEEEPDADDCVRQSLDRRPD